MKDAPAQGDDHQLILNLLTSANSLASIRDALDRIARQSSDKQLNIYLGPVRKVLGSATLQTMDDSVKIKLPIDQVPYSPLIAYCRRNGGT